MQATEQSEAPYGLDWNKMRSELRLRVNRRLSRRGPTVVEDVTQDCLIRLVRAVRREAPRELEALLNHIVGWACKDYFSSLKHQLILSDEPESLAEEALQVLPEEPGFGYEPERFRFVVAEFFRQRGQDGCGHLAEAYFEGRTWKEVAEDGGDTHAAVRRRWSRCVETLRKAAAEDDPDSIFAGWADS